MNGSRLPCEHVEHALEVGEIYFTLQPFQWLYEYKQEFNFAGRSLVWNPDVVFAFATPEGKKKLACAEVQRTPLSVKQWQSKFSIYNSFFEDAYRSAEFQSWRSGATSSAIMPHFYVISSQKNCEGLSVPNRELRIISCPSEIR
ncbi:hypothetical protein J2X61_006677 [Bacillus sp. 3255]|nr:hypothetical protein [Bacillus sp. 3255]